MTGPYFLRHLETGQNNFAPLPCLGALPLLYPGAAPPSVFAIGKYTAPAVALEREYVVDFYANLLMTGQKGTSEFSLGIGG